MLRSLLPVILAVFGAAVGIGAGILLKPSADATEKQLTDTTGGSDLGGAHHASSDVSGLIGADLAESLAMAAGAHGDGETHSGNTDTEFTKLNNQFVVPVLSDGRVRSMVVLSLSLETPAGRRELVYSQEPRIRDTFLQVLFDHANAGGFDGAFTSAANMGTLRGELRRVGRQLLGADVLDVLVIDIARQDLG